MNTWLQDVPWQWFLTLTFPNSLHPSVADRKRLAWTNIIERSHRCPVSYAGSLERTSKGTGMHVPSHFHLIVTSDVVLDEEQMRVAWRRVSGGSNEHFNSKRFQIGAGGIQYCFKSIDTQTTDWFVHRLELCLDDLPGPSAPNHRSIRAARRASLRRPNANFGSRGMLAETNFTTAVNYS
jgi:hypothetical protein